ncbi:UDP-galactose transporter [Trypanosoma theileri]|uniref:UDP-galactose transporter n=1 Tax=Trypanosoma theileri TaxID=67003 RepID=A0A1X0P0F3_9TRYP|nr:UDP-galactose transporter [Trypanosoma theileri]ORC90278.1 UDP-galactose transporter [Trypanosoma theileri]
MTDVKELRPPTLLQKLMSFVILTLVSTTVGVAMKLSQTGGTYTYSPASVVVLTEVYKLIITLLIVWRLVITREELSHSSFSSSSSSSSSVITEMIHILTENVTKDLIWREFLLSLMYTFVNIVTFPIFTYMSASLFFLLKTSSPVVTAIILRFVSDRHISKVRWFAIIMQCLGLLVTQVNFCTGTTAITPMGYILTAANLASSCLAGVYNEKIIKTQASSLNAQNAILYSFGIILNTILHFVAPPVLLGMTEKPDFFEGYKPSTFFVIISNGSVGLVISAVYRYADVLIKTFGIAGSTSLLFLFESMGLLPKDKRTASVGVTFAGVATIFYAAYVYIAPEPQVMESVRDNDDDDDNMIAAPALRRAYTHLCGMLVLGITSIALVFMDYGNCFV